MQKGLISIIIPTRNRRDYLLWAIDTIYRQSYPSFEIIVVDDGSTDNTADALKHYDARLHYICQPHSGAASARNNGIRHAQGEYIAFCDDDDGFLSDKLEKSMEFFEQHPDAVWLCTGFSFIDENNDPLPRPPIIPQKTEYSLHDIALFTFISTSTVMIRKTFLDNIGSFSETSTISEDYHLWSRIFMHGRGGALQQNLAYFRLHKGNTTLPYRKLLKENTRIIDNILASGASGLSMRETYIENLHRIIAESLLYKRKYLEYLFFMLHKIWQRISHLL